MHISSQKLIYDVTVSVSSSRSFAAASKTVQSVRSNQAFKSCSASLVYLLTVLNTGLTDLNFCLYVGKDEPNSDQIVIKLLVGQSDIHPLSLYTFDPIYYCLWWDM